VAGCDLRVPKHYLGGKNPDYSKTRTQICKNSLPHFNGQIGAKLRQRKEIRKTAAEAIVSPPPSKEQVGDGKVIVKSLSGKVAAALPDSPFSLRRKA
jgi:hypothetical protein